MAGSANSAAGEINYRPLHSARVQPQSPSSGARVGSSSKRAERLLPTTCPAHSRVAQPFSPKALLLSCSPTLGFLRFIGSPPLRHSFVCLLCISRGFFSTQFLSAQFPQLSCRVSSPFVGVCFRGGEPLGGGLGLDAPHTHFREHAPSKLVHKLSVSALRGSCFRGSAGVARSFTSATGGSLHIRRSALIQAEPAWRW